MRLAEVWPENIHENELRIGRLPDEKIAETMFLTRADNDVRVGKLGCVQMGRDRILIQLLERQLPLHHLCDIRSLGSRQGYFRNRIHKQVRFRPGI